MIIASWQSKLSSRHRCANLKGGWPLNGLEKAVIHEKNFYFRCPSLSHITNHPVYLDFRVIIL